MYSLWVGSLFYSKLLNQNCYGLNKWRILGVLFHKFIMRSEQRRSSQVNWLSCRSEGRAESRKSYSLHCSINFEIFLLNSSALALWMNHRHPRCQWCCFLNLIIPMFWTLLTSLWTQKTTCFGRSTTELNWFSWVSFLYQWNFHSFIISTW